MKICTSSTYHYGRVHPKQVKHMFPKKGKGLVYLIKPLTYTSIYQAFSKEVKWLKRAHKSIHTPKANAPLKTGQNTKLFSRLYIVCFNARAQWWSSVQKLHKEAQQNKLLLKKTTFLYNVNMIGKRQK